MNTEPEEMYVFETFSTGTNNATDSFNELTKLWKEEDEGKSPVESKEESKEHLSWWLMSQSKLLQDIKTNEIEEYLKQNNPKFIELFENNKFSTAFEKLKTQEVDGEGLLNLNLETLTHSFGFLIGHALLILSTVEKEKKPKKREIDFSEAKRLMEKLKKEHYSWIDFTDVEICLLLDLKSEDLANGIGKTLDEANSFKEYLKSELKRRKWITEATLALNLNKF
jgi:hypothetical protein